MPVHDETVQDGLPSTLTVKGTCTLKLSIMHDVQKRLTSLPVNLEELQEDLNLLFVKPRHCMIGA